MKIRKLSNKKSILTPLRYLVWPLFTLHVLFYLPQNYSCGPSVEVIKLIKDRAMNVLCDILGSKR